MVLLSTNQFLFLGNDSRNTNGRVKHQCLHPPFAPKEVLLRETPKPEPVLLFNRTQASVSSIKNTNYQPSALRSAQKIGAWIVMPLSGVITASACCGCSKEKLLINAYSSTPFKLPLIISDGV